MVSKQRSPERGISVFTGFRILNDMKLAFIFIIGLCVGSFLNVILSRLGRRGGIIAGRSACPHCGRKLLWHDLVPIISFLALGGRCRFCRGSISFRYPAVEFLTAVVLTLFFWRMGLSADLLTMAGAVLVVGLLALAFFDITAFWLPDIITVPLIVLAVARSVAGGVPVLRDALMTGFVLAGAFGILYVVSGRRWIGFGDVKLAFLVGLLFGYPIAPLVVLAGIWTAAFMGIVLVVLRRATLKTALPLGAFLAGAAILALMFFHEISLFVKSLF